MNTEINKTMIRQMGMALEQGDFFSLLQQIGGAIVPSAAELEWK